MLGGKEEQLARMHGSGVGHALAQAAVDPSPLQQLAMIQAYRQMMTEMSAVFATPPTGLSVEAEAGSSQQPQPCSPAAGTAADATSVHTDRTLHSCVQLLQRAEYRQYFLAACRHAGPCPSPKPHYYCCELRWANLNNDCILTMCRP